MPYDIVFFTLFRTDNPYSSISLSMAKELAKTHRVFYVNHPYSWKDVVTGLLRGDRVLRARLPRLLRGKVGYEGVDTIPENFTAAQPPPTLPVNWLPKGRLYDFFQRLNNGIILRAIRRVLRDHGIREYIFINCYDPFYAGYLPKEMGAALCIYHCIDDISQNPYTAKHGLGLEIEAVLGADLTFVTSTNLKKLLIRRTDPTLVQRNTSFAENTSFAKTEEAPAKLVFRRTADRIVTYFNAADVSVFQKVLREKYPRPAELAGRSGQVIGFIGNLDELRIDYPLLKKTALAHPDKTLLLVGPVNSPAPKAIGLDLLPNVVFAGSRRLEQLPPLLQHMDCVLIPFLCNTLTESIYPLKINEYLAAGKPVVSTGFSDDIRGFADCIYLADSHEAFVQRIDRAIAENNPDRIKQRTAVARENTWEARIKQLWEVVANYDLRFTTDARRSATYDQSQEVDSPETKERL